MKKLLIICLCLGLCGCSNQVSNKNNNEVEYSNVIVLNGDSATFNGKIINEYDYVWNLDPNNEEEYYEGTKPNENDDIYIAHDIIYYPEISEENFSLIEYDGEMEWATYYTNEELNEYIFSTLPNLGENLPSEMMHSKQDAYNNPVLHINKAGEYLLQGSFNGQIKIDLGEEAFNDKTQKVTLILDNVDINCSVAPGIIFNSVYESDNEWEEKESYSNKIDIADAGAKVVIKDGTINNVTGANVYRLLKPKYKNESTTVQKKRYKTDGAFYSYESLLITGENNGSGILNITSSTYEGLNSELHLQIDSGNINIVSQDDGINVNEDNVSVFKMNGGRLTIFAGQGAEGDVIDSNGYIVINGGTLLGTSPSMPDDLLDSECGSEVSDEATIIKNGSLKNNMNNNFRPQNGMFNDFDPNNMPKEMMPKDNQMPRPFDEKEYSKNN